jgi:hypothetical protein
MSDPRQLRLFSPDDDAPAEVAVTITPAVPGAAVEKRCSKCRQTLPLARFNRASARPDGLQVWCKACEAEAGRARRRRLQAREEIALPAEKQCSSCGEAKPADEFGCERARPDGLRASCKQCEAVARKANKNINTSRRTGATAKWKYRANKVVEYAIIRGRLTRSKCLACGHGKVNCHHFSYAEPDRLRVVFLCPKCHPRFGHGGASRNPPLPLIVTLLAATRHRRLVDAGEAPCRTVTAKQLAARGSCRFVNAATGGDS